MLDGRLVSPDRRFLERPAHWPPSLVAGAGYAVRLQEWQDTGYVPTVAEVCEVTLADSRQRRRPNWLLQAAGGPAAVTALARSLGDTVTTLTRWEPDLNVWVPGQLADHDYAARDRARPTPALLLGDALHPRQRHRLVTWMRGNRTGDIGAERRACRRAGRQPIRPAWGNFGTRNDVGIALDPVRRPRC